MDNAITCLFLFIVLALVIWAFVKRYSGDYDEGWNGSEGGTDSGTEGDDISGTSWTSPWSTSSRRRMGSFSESSSRISTSSSSGSSSRSSSGSRSSGVTKNRPTKSYDSPKVRTRSGFGRGK